MSDEQWQVAGSAAQLYERELVRFGSARELLAAYGAGSPLAGPIGDAGPAARAGLLGEVHAALGPWQSPAGLASPIEALLVSGHHEG